MQKKMIKKSFDLKVFGVVFSLSFLAILIVTGLIFTWCDKSTDFVKFCIENWKQLGIVDCASVGLVGVGSKVSDAFKTHNDIISKESDQQQENPQT